ncbi:hypothetical protein FH972_027122 [Carpinus fangiana]|uniref:Uncharacterized protein n=1 Tax=Carpinus fangiana TaxID=176857 RepID=A0A5N6L624_9ROSI|nr:hypothetical protein FH972_027122 [Carpinus fangiana]
MFAIVAKEGVCWLEQRAGEAIDGIDQEALSRIQRSRRRDRKAKSFSNIYFSRTKGIMSTIGEYGEGRLILDRLERIDDISKGLIPDEEISIQELEDMIKYQKWIIGIHAGSGLLVNIPGIGWLFRGIAAIHGYLEKKNLEKLEKGLEIYTARKELKSLRAQIEDLEKEGICEEAKKVLAVLYSQMEALKLKKKL